MSLGYPAFTQLLDAAAKSQIEIKPEADDTTKPVLQEQTDDHSHMAEGIRPVKMWCSKNPTDIVDVYHENSLEVEESSSCKFKQKTILESTVVEQSVPVVVQRQAPEEIIHYNSSHFELSSSTIEETLVMHCQDMTDEVTQVDYEGTSNDYGNIDVDIKPDCIIQDGMIHGEKVEIEEKCPSFIIEAVSSQAFVENGGSLWQDVSAACQESQENMYLRMFEGNTDNGHETGVEVDISNDNNNISENSEGQEAVVTNYLVSDAENKKLSFNRSGPNLNHKCTVCHKEFNRTTNLRRHMFTHTEERPHQCIFCHRTFKTVPDRTLHMKIHHTIALKELFFKGPERKLSHKCTVCHKEFSLITNLRTHMFTHTEERPHQCTFCHRTFKTVPDRNLHMKIHYTIALKDWPFKGLERKLSHKCTVCHKEFSQITNLRRHMFTHTEERPHQCTFCHRTFKTVPDRTLHMKTHHPIALKDWSFKGPERKLSHKCTVCHKEFSRTANLRTHMFTHIEKRPHQCTFCHRTFKTVPDRTLHMKTHHPIALKDWSFKVKGPQRKLSHKCTVCHKEFSLITNLRRHMFTHTEERPHQCTFCHRTFKTVPDRTLHMKTHHPIALKDWSFKGPERKLSHKCTVCHKEFSRKTNLRKHMFTHTEERPHQCTFCHRTFKTVFDRNLHMKIFHPIVLKDWSFKGPQRKLNHKCTVCHKEFSRTTDLRKHMFTHTEGQEAVVSNYLVSDAENEKLSFNKSEKKLKHKCTVCNKQFGWIQSLRRHMFTHTEERPHQCTFCHRTFKTVTDRNLHIKNHHTTAPKQAEADIGHKTAAAIGISDNNRLSENSEGQEAVVTNYLVGDAENENEKLSFNRSGPNLSHKCTVCDKWFGWISNLRRHMSTHTDERPYECTFCHRTFKRVYDMKMHLKIHNKIDSRTSLGLMDDIDDCSRKPLGLIDKDIDDCSRKPLGLIDKDIDDCSRKPLGLIDKDIDDCLDKECYVLLTKTKSLHGPHLSKLEKMTCDGADVKRTSVSPKKKDLISCLVVENSNQRGDSPPQTNRVSKACKCCICNKLFNNTGNLGQHLIIHTDQKLCRCNGCNKQFNSIVNLNRHMMINHVKLKPFKCSMCSKVFKSSLCLKIHVKQHVEEVNVKSMEDGRWKETDGGDISDPQRRIASHNLENPFECILCDRTFKVVYDLNIHHMKCHEPFEPKDSKPSATAMMATIDEKDKHNESEEHPDEDLDATMLRSDKRHENLQSKMPPNSQSGHNDEFTETENVDLPDSQVPACVNKCENNIANKPLSDSGIADSNDNVNYKKIQILSSIVDGKRKFMCSRCGKKFPKAFSAQRHIALHYPEKPYKCTLCAKDFKVVYDLNTHMKRSHPDINKGSFNDNDELESDENSDEKKHCVKCLYCGKSFCSISNLRRHVLMHSSNKTPYSCTKCGKTFKFLYDLNKHSENHSQDDLYVSDVENDQKSGVVCSVCGKVFTRRSTLKRHMASHSVVKPYHCLICNKSFRVFYYLNRHMRLYHGDIGFSCHVCQKTFPNVRSLEKHQKTHAKKRLKKCPVCKKKFELVSDMNKHMESHTQMNGTCHKQTEKFLCSICGMTFQLQSSLTKHNLRHTVGEEKLWECFMCGIIFDKRSELKKHMKVHGDSNDISIDDEELSSLTEGKSGSNDKVYKCCICDLKFQGSDNLLKHSSIHYETEQLICMDCDNIEIDESSLERHYLIAHVRIVPFRCAVCAKMFHSLNDFKVHLKVHTSLNEHINWDSTNASPFVSGLKFVNEEFENEKIAKKIECDENIESGDHLLQKSKILFKCCLCIDDNEFAGKSHLREHMSIHCYFETLRCKGCDKIASTKSNLKRHAMMDHSKMIPVNCSWCLEFLENETDYELHMKFHGAVESSKGDASRSQVDLDSTDLTPSVCGPVPVNQMDGEGEPNDAEFYGVKESDKDNVQESSPVMNNLFFECCICKDNNIFEGKMNLRNHMSIHCSFELLRCRKCGKTTTTKSNLRRHMMMAHVKMVPDVQKLNQIELDGLEPPKAVLESKCSSVSQIKTGSDNIVYKCCICNDGNRFEGKDNIRKHVSTHCYFEHLMCQGCGHVLSSRSNVIRHMMDIHIKRVPLKCSECLKVFKSITDLNIHMKVHKALNELRSDFNCNEPSTSTSSSQRDVIVKDFDSADNNLNFNPTVEVVPVLPDLCDSELVNVIRDNTMTKAIESDEIDDVQVDDSENLLFTCYICKNEERLKGKKRVSKHVSIHCDLEQNKCIKCDKGWNCRSNLKRHMIVAHLKMLPVKCVLCCEILDNLPAFEKHMKVHKKVQELENGLFVDNQLYKCCICTVNDIFEGKMNIRNHMLIHCNLELLRCLECGKRATNKSNVKRHMMSTHVKMVPPGVQTLNQKEIDRGKESGIVTLDGGNGESGNVTLDGGNRESDNVTLDNDGNRESGNVTLDGGNRESDNVTLDGGNRESDNVTLDNDGNRESGNVTLDGGNRESDNVTLDGGNRESDNVTLDNDGNRESGNVTLDNDGNRESDNVTLDNDGNRESGNVTLDGGNRESDNVTLDNDGNRESGNVTLDNDGNRESGNVTLDNDGNRESDNVTLDNDGNRESDNVTILDNLTAFEKHMKVKVHKKVQELENGLFVDNQLYKCCICMVNDIFEGKMNIKNHMLIHCNLELLRCLECGKRATNKSNVKRHMMSTHVKMVPPGVQTLNQKEIDRGKESGNVTLDGGNGESGNVTLDGGNRESDNVTLDNDGNRESGNVTLDNDGNRESDNVTLDNDGNRESGNVTLDNDGNRESDNVTLDNDGNRESGNVTLDNDGNRESDNVTLDNDGNVTLDNDGNRESGNVTLDGGNRESDNVTLDNDGNRESGNVTLDNDGNRESGNVTLDGGNRESDNVTLDNDGNRESDNVTILDNLTAFEKHMKVKVHKKVQELENGLFVDNQLYKCCICTVIDIFEGKMNIRNHMLIHCNLELLRCLECGKRATNKSNVKRHMMSTHVKMVPPGVQTLNQKEIDRGKESGIVTLDGGNGESGNVTLDGGNRESDNVTLDNDGNRESGNVTLDNDGNRESDNVTLDNDGNRESGNLTLVGGNRESDNVTLDNDGNRESGNVTLDNDGNRESGNVTLDNDGNGCGNVTLDIDRKREYDP